MRSISGDFVYLDHLEVTQNPVVTNFAEAIDSFAHPATNVVLAGRGFYYRPLYFFSYAVVYRIAGPQPWAFHLFQLALFCSTVWLVFLLGIELFSETWIAFLGALLWVAHPAHVEDLAWISSLCDVGCTLFCVLALLLFIRTEGRHSTRVASHLAPASAFLIALFFKEMAIALPVLLFAYWLFVAPAESWTRRALRFGPYLAAFGFYLFLRRHALGRLTAGGDAPRVSSGLLGSSVTLLGAHTKIFVWPSHLSLGRTAGLFENSFFPWPVILLGALLIALAIRKRGPVFAFLIFCWPLALLPVLDVRQITPPYAADRFSYLPSVCLCLAIAYAVAFLLPSVVFRELPRWLPASALAALAFVWATLAVRNIPHWHDDATLARYSISQSPEIPTFHCLLGRSLFAAGGDLAAASSEFESTLRLSPATVYIWRSAANCGHMGLANVAEARGQFAEAARQYDLAAVEMPANFQAYQALASLYVRRKDYEAALDPLRKLVELNPSNLEARFDLGVCLLRLGRYGEALEQLQVVDLADPDFPNILEAKQQASEHLPPPAPKP